MIVGLTKRFETYEANFSTILMDSLCTHDQMPRSQDSAIFMLMITDYKEIGLYRGLV